MQRRWQRGKWQSSEQHSRADLKARPAGSVDNLSQPPGLSVNDHVCKQLSSLHYTSVDTALDHIMQLGLLGASRWMSSMRITTSNSPRPQAHAGDGFVDKTLPFGLCSTLKIFMAVANTLEKEDVYWCIQYIDDFLTARQACSVECQACLEIIKWICARLGVPLKGGSGTE